MAKGSILEPGKSYIFRNYFEMPYEPDDILAEFGYSLELTTVDWPSFKHPFRANSASQEEYSASFALCEAHERSRP